MKNHHYLFPVSLLSTDELHRVVSVWLGLQLVNDDGDAAFSSSAPIISIPMVYSHHEWFVQCVPALGSSLTICLDNDEMREQMLIEVVRSILGLTMRVPKGARSREEMSQFMSALVALLRCSEKPISDQTRRLAQKAFVALLDRFDFVAQFLLISHLFQVFQMVWSHEVTCSNEAYEPHLLGWLTDIFRSKCYGGINDEPKECRELFRRELGHFYAQIHEVVYEDPLIAVNFYNSVSLLVANQAIHRHRLAILRAVGQPWIQRNRSQLRDWMELRKIHKMGQENLKEGESEVEEIMIGHPENNYPVMEDEQIRVRMLNFQFEEAERRIFEALN